MKADAPADPAPLNPRSLLARTPLFAALPETDLAALAARAQERRMHRGETLFQRGDPGSAMLAILAGEVRISLAAAAGREQVLRVLRAGEVFGEIALLDGRPRSADAVALTSGRLLVLERRHLLARLQADAALALRIIAILCERLRATDAQLGAMLFHDAETRLAATLLSLSQVHRQRRVDVTQSMLGEIVGASRETVNRKLRGWEQSGVVTLSPGRIVLRDPKALAALLPEASGA